MTLEMKEEASMRRFSVNTGTQLTTTLPNFDANKNGSLSLFANSIVKLSEGWHIFNVVRKDSATDTSGIIDSVSSTYLL